MPISHAKQQSRNVCKPSLPQTVAALRHCARPMPALGAVALCMVAAACSLRNQTAHANPKTPGTAVLVFAGDIMLADRPGQCIASGIDPFKDFAGIDY